MSSSRKTRKLAVEISESYYKKLKIITINRDIQLKDLFMEILDEHFNKKKNNIQTDELVQAD